MRLATILIFLFASSSRAMAQRRRAGETAQTIVSTAPFVAPLDLKIDMRIRDGSLQAFFEALSRQSKTKYAMVQGLAQCRISAFIHNLNTRQTLQMVLAAGGFSYQQLGPSDTYTITRRGPACPSVQAAPAGRCKAGNPSISMECKRAPLSSFAEILFDQSDANIILWNEAVNFPVSITLDKAKLQDVLREVRRRTPLDVRQVGVEDRFVVTVPAPQSTDQNVNQSTNTYIYITPTETKFLKPGMPN